MASIWDKIALLWVGLAAVYASAQKRNAPEIAYTSEDKIQPRFLLTGSRACYGDLGCFSTGGAFTSLYRPIGLVPQSPAHINTKFMLYTRRNSANHTRQYLRSTDFNSITHSDFDPERKTKFVVHGFLENGYVDWMSEMKDEFLKYGDFNVVLVDWGGGSGIPYTQATANTRVVGAEIAKLIKVIQAKTTARPQDMHIIGHSLGAHICGYAGERTPNLGRISGLDPAEPYFQYTDTSVRLDPSDATFVDVMHTDGASIVKLGYGMIQPCGHVDYFPNEGYVQPGCDKNPIDQIRIEGDIYNGGKEFVACSHLRAYKYFTESINSVCPFNGYSCSSYANFQRGLCLPCPGGQCGYMGFHADRVKPRSGQTHVKYYLNTGDNGPFCRYHYQVDISFGSLGYSSSEKGTLFVNLKGSNGETGEHQLNEKSNRWDRDLTPRYSASDLGLEQFAHIDSVFSLLSVRCVITIQSGHKYGFMLTSTHDIGSLSQMEFRWELDNHWYNPLTWSALLKHAIHIDKADIVNGETENKRSFCAFNAGIDAGVTRKLTTTC